MNAETTSLRARSQLTVSGSACAHLTRLLLLLAVCTISVSAQRIITTVAGSAPMFRGDGGPAIEAGLGRVRGVAVDVSGNLFVADSDNSLILKISTDGSMRVVAGNGIQGQGFSGDGGPAIDASLLDLADVAVDATGNLFIADWLNNRIRRVGTDGTIQTVAGNGIGRFSGDGGPAIDASLSLPQGVAVDGSGNLFIADTFNNRVRQVRPDGSIRTVAGNGDQGFSGDGGPAINASLFFPSGVAVDTAGNLFIADWLNYRIRRVSPEGVIDTVAGTGLPLSFGDGGLAINASIAPSQGVAVDGSGNLFIAETSGNRVRQVSPDGTIRTVAGNGFEGFSGDGGPAFNASLGFPEGVAVDDAGNLFIADTENLRIRQVSPDGIIETVAGSGLVVFAGDGGPAAAATLDSPQDIAVDAVGNLFIADTGQHRIRQVSLDGTIRAVAGNGMGGFSGDGGMAADASLGFPQGVTIDAAANLFIADSRNDRIRMVSPNGTIRTVAGNGIPFFFGDGGPAIAASLAVPGDVAVDVAGNLFIADSFNQRVRRVGLDGIIQTVAGNGTNGFSGDGGPAVGSSLGQPAGLVVDIVGTLFIADTGNHRVRRISPDGIIQTFAGNGIEDFAGDGEGAVFASLDSPEGVEPDTAGNVLIADTGNNRIRQVSPDGVIQTFAGNGIAGFSGDGGPATDASLSVPRGVVVDKGGNVFIADSFNPRRSWRWWLCCQRVPDCS